MQPDVRVCDPSNVPVPLTTGSVFLSGFWAAGREAFVFRAVSSDILAFFDDLTSAPSSERFVLAAMMLIVTSAHRCRYGGCSTRNFFCRPEKYRQSDRTMRSGKWGRLSLRVCNNPRLPFLFSLVAFATGRPIY